MRIPFELDNNNHQLFFSVIPRIHQSELHFPMRSRDTNYQSGLWGNDACVDLSSHPWAALSRTYFIRWLFSMISTRHDDVIKYKHFHVTGHLCGEFTGHRWIPRTQRQVTRNFDVFFDLCLNKQLRKQWWGWWFETPLRSLWRHCNGMCWFIQPSKGCFVQDVLYAMVIFHDIDKAWVCLCQ